MSRLLENELKALENGLLALSARVEEALQKALKAVETRDAELAAQVQDADAAIDAAEVELEEECLKTLALHQPVAIDLRLLVSALKINNDLERVGDRAVTIARAAAFLANHAPVEIPSGLRDMAEEVWRMYRNSMDSMVKMDSQLARDVIAADSRVDAMNNAMQAYVMERCRERPERLEGYMYLLRASRSLERIGDHATNIAEDVIYMLDGEIVRHQMN
jgi:phosphate transport system protein